MKKYIVGRSEKCDICLHHSRVSSQHASLWVDDEGYVWISDLQSTNGTFVDGIIVDNPVKLNHGSVVFLADQAFDWESAAIQLFPKVQVGENDIVSQQTEKTKRRSSGLQVSALIAIIGTIGFGIFVFALDNEMTITSSVKSNDSQVVSPSGESDGQMLPGRTKVKTETAAQNPNRNPRWTAIHVPIVYDYSCLDDEGGIYQVTRIGAGIQDAVMGLSDREISVADEMRVGEELKRDMLQQYRVWHNASARERTNRIFNELVRTIEQPKGISYELILIDAKDVNAFTCGGKVFLFKGIYEFLKSDDELASVLAHEIQHNELGHINRMLKKVALAEDLFGEAGMIAVLADKVLFASFGQKDESECDLHGVDHIVRLGYNGCSAAEVWKRLAMNEQEDDFEKLLRSHPFSKDRKACIVAHIKNNYGHSCRK